MTSRGAPLPERIAAYIVVDPVTGCHEWVGTKNYRGYGRLRIGGRLIGAHRVAYELSRGAIPDGLVIDHLCRNRACCNPDHLEAVTHAENVRRGLSGAAEAARTHCPQGHPYDAANTYVSRAGHRHCIACRKGREKNRDWSAAWAARKTKHKRRGSSSECGAGSQANCSAAQSLDGGEG